MWVIKHCNKNCHKSSHFYKWIIKSIQLIQCLQNLYRYDLIVSKGCLCWKYKECGSEINILDTTLKEVFEEICFKTENIQKTLCHKTTGWSSELCGEI